MKRRSLESYLDDDAAEVPQQENDLPEDRVVEISLRRTFGVSRRLRLGVEVDHRRVGQRLQQQRRLVRRHRRRDDVHVLASLFLLLLLRQSQSGTKLEKNLKKSSQTGAAAASRDPSVVTVFFSATG